MLTVLCNSSVMAARKLRPTATWYSPTEEVAGASRKENPRYAQDMARTALRYNPLLLSRIQRCCRTLGAPKAEASYRVRRNRSVKGSGADKRVHMTSLEGWIQGYRATELQGYRATGLQGYRATGLQGYRATGLQGYRDTETQGHRDTGTQGHRDTETQRHRDTGTQGHGDTGTAGDRDTARAPAVLLEEMASTSMRRAASYTRTLRHCHRYSCSFVADLRWGSTPNIPPITCAQQDATKG
jgi:hypothetical protein